MALSTVLQQELAKQQGVTAPVQPAVQPVVQPAVQPATAPKRETSEKKEEVKDLKKAHAELLREGRQIRNEMSEEEKQLERSKSDTIAFVCALGDPRQSQPRKQGNENIPSYRVVGYEFKALEDVDVPVVRFNRFPEHLMDVVPNFGETVHRKAGEVFHLNLYETGLFISRLEYGGQFSGEGTVVEVMARFAQDRPVPLVVLKKAGVNGGSIKENIKLIATVEGADPSRNIKGTLVVKPEYEDTFGPLFERRSTGGRRVSAPKASTPSLDLAAALRGYLTKAHDPKSNTNI